MAEAEWRGLLELNGRHRDKRRTRITQFESPGRLEKNRGSVSDHKGMNRPRYDDPPFWNIEGFPPGEAVAVNLEAAHFDCDNRTLRCLHARNFGDGVTGQGRGIFFNVAFPDSLRR